MQLVLSNNRVLSHGENFIAMGGVVINTETGAKYENATIAECENCPSDIGEVGYEYHAGAFVPCAPYGKGNGNVPVLCDRDCKSIKDSGIHLNSIGRVETLTYEGTGATYVELTFSATPHIVFITTDIEEYDGEPSEFGVAIDGLWFGWEEGEFGYSCGNRENAAVGRFHTIVDGTTLEIYVQSDDKFNKDGVKYKAVAIIKGEE